jgi:hypothetical protein
MPALTETPWYLIDRVFGFEDDGGDGDDGDDGDDDGDDGDDSDDGDDGDDGADDGDKGTKGKAEDTTGLKNALKAERLRAKKAERELKKFQRESGKKDDDDKQTVAEAQEARDTATAKSEKLATRLRTTELNNVITRFATKLKFRDIDDALSLLKREDDWVEQDEDDPSDIEIDDSAVEAALAKLAKAKPHLLVADGDGEPSGGKFGGRKDGKKDALSEEVLSSKYSALGRRRAQQAPASNT